MHESKQSTPLMWQDLSHFVLPNGFRGRSGLKVQLWWMVQATLFRMSPQIAYGYRRWLLRVFGATIGAGVIVRPTATFTYPWKVKLGDYCWIGDNTVLYSLGDISVGAHSVISQGTYVCAGDHDYTSPNFDIRARPISIGRECWVAAFSFLSPGCSIGDGAVIAARSTVLGHAEGGWVHAGSPTRAVKFREVVNEVVHTATIPQPDAVRSVVPWPMQHQKACPTKQFKDPNYQ